MIESAQPQQFFALEAQWVRVCQDLAVNTLRAFALPQNPGGRDGPYREILSVARQAVDDTLELERDWVAVFSRLEEAVPYAQPLATSNAAMMRAAIDGREPLWHAWFDAAERLADASDSSNGAPFWTNHAFEAWKNTAEGMEHAAQNAPAQASQAESAQASASSQAGKHAKASR